MENNARVIIFVQDYKLNPYVEAKVQIRPLKNDKWQTVSFDETSQRFVKKDLTPGEFEVRIQGEKEWMEDVRTLKLNAGVNIINSTLAPKNIPYYIAADGERIYFKPDKGKVLIHVRGKDFNKSFEKLVEKMGLKVGDPLIVPGQRPRRNSASFLISVPKSSGKHDKVMMELTNMTEQQFPKFGIKGRLAVPMFRGKVDEVVEGLTNELVVKFKSGVSEDQLNQIVETYGFTILRKIPYLGNAYLLRHREPPNYKILSPILKLIREDNVVFVEPNIIFPIVLDQYQPNDFLFLEQPHLGLISAPDAWDVNPNLRAGSPNITIAVFDGNGIDPNHPDLTGNLSDGSAKMTADFDFENMSPQTAANLDGSHGTQCASSATGRFDDTDGGVGVAGNCHLIGAQLPSWVTGIDMADAWIWAAGFDPGSTDPNFPNILTDGADVISNSWGVNGSALTETIKGALDFLTTYGRGGKGCIICFSIGNTGYIDFTTDAVLRRMYAAYERTIAVGASINANPTSPCDSFHADHNGNLNNLPAVVDTRTYYSPYGPSLDIVSPSHTSYDLALPFPHILDPILAAVETDTGTWPANSTVQTTITAAVALGATVIQVANSTGFQVGEFALFNDPGVAPIETKEIVAVAPGQITVQALENGYPVGTNVYSGPNHYARNPDRGFGGTSHSCPTVAGAVALILSEKSYLSWNQVKEILHLSADQIDVGQVNAIGQWVDNDGDGVAEFSQWYGYGRLNVHASLVEAQQDHWVTEGAAVGDFVVVWEDDRDRNGYYQIYARGFNANSTERFADFAVNTVAAGQQLKPKVDLGQKGEFVVVWQDDKDKNGYYQIFARGFNADGTERFSDITVNSVASGQQLKPAIAMSPLNSEFVVVWEDDRDRNGYYQIYARGFNADGIQRFAEITVNSVAAGQQLKPKIAMGLNGDFVVVWEDDRDGNGYYQIFARGFNSDGTERFAEIKVNSVAAGQQRSPTVAMSPLNGDFVVVWEDDKDKNGYYQIYARGFNGQGFQRFADITVNSVASGQQRRPAVAMDVSGEFVVAWEDDKDKNGYYQIYARGFNADGTQRFADITVNSVASGQQFRPAIAMTVKGNFVVAWEDDKDKNGYYQIYARGFNADDTQRFSDITVNSIAAGQQLKPDVAIMG